MENKHLSRKLRLLSQLMELHNQNPFKIKSIANAALKVDKLPFAIASKSIEEIEQIEGLGKSISAKIWELLQTGDLAELRELLVQTPEGIVEMMGIKGIGPKKILVIWKDLGIETVGELHYACNENRLIEAKGFGLKTQDEIIKIIEFKMASEGKLLYAQAEGIVNSMYADLAVWLNGVSSDPLLGIAGDYRRCCEIIKSLEFVVGASNTEEALNRLLEYEPLEFAAEGNILTAKSIFGLKITLLVVDRQDFYLEWFRHTGNAKHVTYVLSKAGEGPFGDEREIYSGAGMDYVEPELREGLNEIDWAENNKLPVLITYEDLKGTLHNHSTWSDGVNTLEEMALYCRDELKLEYLGISDHSRSAFYAKGLDEHRVYAQHREIEALNQKLSPFRIFKGIESDILYDGSLDYPEEILKTFDFVVASVHSILRMDVEKATSRLITAIENPYTTILGHPTGRLLLSREGYPIDYKKVIDACAANGVIIEINSNPLRLDLDWRWQQYALEKGVLLSINPDAHRISGFHDTHYGIHVARKGGLQAEACLNAMTLDQIIKIFDARNSKI